MSLNSKKICFSLVLAAAAGMVQAANGSCLLADAGFVAVQDNTASAGNYSSNRPKEKQRLFRSTAVEKEIARVQQLACIQAMLQAQKYDNTGEGPTNNPPRNF